MRPTKKPIRSKGQFRPGKRFRRKKVCRFCADKIEYIDFKNAPMLRNFVTERGKIMSGRMSGTCSSHQRELNTAIKRARNIALLPYTVI